MSVEIMSCDWSVPSVYKHRGQVEQCGDDRCDFGMEAPLESRDSCGCYTGVSVCVPGRVCSWVVGLYDDCVTCRCHITVCL